MSVGHLDHVNKSEPKMLSSVISVMIMSYQWSRCLTNTEMLCNNTHLCRARRFCITDLL